MIKKFNEMKVNEDWEDEIKWSKDKHYFIITYTESGDEIHFILMDMKHYEYVRNANLPDMNMAGVNEFIEFVHNNKIDSKWVQTYTDSDWFSKHKIERVISIPELGM